jgi:hypothetical protein
MSQLTVENGTVASAMPDGGEIAFVGLFSE